ncbi:TetR/AcrR family transcriptional regulator [Gordonia soli]|uniref:Putative TetR family transcriptional regulator n=1 Tax=Gordonia soli NBRC 108243 TaxID=1223545 RepID=M0QIM8_9ACTN|nr:TetR/AcrR family transcriptional regulator [Gordonia soli]GAC67292.1 putative TetR family transcriptional regulator [Gordonia soli NBRC 108243]
MVAKNSRVAAQAETRRLLKEHGREMMLASGFASASVSAIATRAGFTTGAFYSNFESKAELTLEILADLQAEAEAQLTAIFADDNARGGRIERIRAWTDETLDSGWPRLELEFALANRDNVAVVSTEGTRNRTAVDGITGFVEQVLPEQLSTLPIRRVAELVLDLCFGLAVRRIIDPSVSTSHLFDLVEQLAAGFDATPAGRG